MGELLSIIHENILMGMAQQNRIDINNHKMDEKPQL